MGPGAGLPGWIHGPGNDGFIKLIADTGTGILVGATSAGLAGGEVLGTLAVAVHARVSVTTLSQMIYANPTLHRAIEDAIASSPYAGTDRITTAQPRSWQASRPPSTSQGGRAR